MATVRFSQRLHDEIIGNANRMFVDRIGQSSRAESILRDEYLQPGRPFIDVFCLKGLQCVHAVCKHLVGAYEVLYILKDEPGFSRVLCKVSGYVVLGIGTKRSPWDEKS